MSMWWLLALQSNKQMHLSGWMAAGSAAFVQSEGAIP